MIKKNSYIAAAALAILGTAGIAGWLAFDANNPGAQQALAVTQPAAHSGVSETEAVLPVTAPAPAASTPSAAISQSEPAPARIGGVVPARRASRTPIAAAAPARANREQPDSTGPIATAATAAYPEGRSNPSNPDPRPESVPQLEPTVPVERHDLQVPRFVEVVVPANAVLGVRLSTSLSSDTAEVEDRVEATVTRDVIADGRIAIPAGTKVLGSVNEVTRGGKFKERARLSVRFHTLVLADGTRETVRVDSVVREGDSPARDSAARIGGGAVGGAIIGGLMGGRKGAILGGVAGAGAGTAAVAAGDRSVATLTAGAPLSVRLDAPVTIRKEQQ